MKEKLLSLVLLGAPVVAFAKLKVKSKGNVVAGTELETGSAYNISLPAGKQLTTGIMVRLIMY